jgi:hypothetical protein
MLAKRLAPSSADAGIVKTGLKVVDVPLITVPTGGEAVGEGRFEVNDVIFCPFVNAMKDEAMRAKK